MGDGRTCSVISDLRSLIPTGVRVLTLTETATMETPTLVSVVPDRGNVLFVTEKTNLVIPSANKLLICI